MSTQTIADLCELRLQYFKLEGNYARLRRETEMKITELHVKALEYKLPLGMSYDDVNSDAVKSSVQDRMNNLTNRESPLWTRSDEVLHTFTSGDDNRLARKATVHFNGDFYYVKMYENGALLNESELYGKSERYAEDCAENWVLRLRDYFPQIAMGEMG